MGVFEVPTKFAGKTLKQLQGSTGFAFRPDVLAGLAGVSENQPLTAGQKISFRDDPGASEYQFLSRFFDPAGTASKAAAKSFQQDQRARSDEFIGRVQQIPDTLEALRQEIGLPEARAAFGEAGDESRRIAAMIRDVPVEQRQGTQGRGITENVLARLIAQKTQELQPSAETSLRGFEQRSANLNNLLSEFQTRSQQIFTPLEIEAGVLGQQAQNELALFQSQAKNALDRELAQIAERGAMDRAQLERATQLAQIEAGKGELVNLGDRVGYFIDGKEVSSTQIGLSPLRPSTGGGNVTADSRYE